MKCPGCGHGSRTVDSKSNANTNFIYRRRECLDCASRFSTKEIHEEINMDCELVTKNARRNLKEYVEKAGLECLVVGDSGGIDSAVCIALASFVCNELDIPLKARSISIESNKPDEEERARMIGEAYGTDFKEVDFTVLYLAKKATYEFEEGPMDKIGLGNLKARTRMEYLYGIAGKYRGMVLSTDNFTEYLLGFWTLHGDVGDFGMIQNLWKHEVYALAEYLASTGFPNQKDAMLDCVAAVPTDGLGISNSDLDQIIPDWTKQFSDCREAYTFVDKVLRDTVDPDWVTLEKEDTSSPIFLRHNASIHKRLNPINIPRDALFQTY